MAETNHATPADSAPSNTITINPPRVPLHKIYALPIPIRTFPLPSFYPSNPISLVHLIYAWLRQTLGRPRDEPSIYRGVWSPETRSVHVTDMEDMRALWEQGFFGKGSLSRSEPNWMKREQIRRGLVDGNVSEQLTRERREERQRAKWERARSEQEAIERTRLEETQANGANASVGTDDSQELEQSQLVVGLGSSVSPDPVGPLQLFQSPNSEGGLKAAPGVILPPNGCERSQRRAPLAPVGPLELLRLPNSEADLKMMMDKVSRPHDGSLSFHGDWSREYTSHPGVDLGTQSSASAAALRAALIHINSPPAPVVNGAATSIPLGPLAVVGYGETHGVNGAIDHKLNGRIHAETFNGDDEPKPLKRQKSVRFSAEVESTTFQHNDPPSPGHSTSHANSELRDLSKQVPLSNGSTVETALKSTQPSSAEMENREHLQLSTPEAFYLVFAIGALAVVDPKTKAELSAPELLHIFADHSYFPPRICSPVSPGLRTDDPFLIQYVVYHHFRSLGWVPREGVKFGVDWLLYRRGPVFDHAEFGLLVLPSFSDPLWKDHVPKTRGVSWHWLFGIQRVLTHVLKSLVLVYVEVPPPPVLERLSGPEGGGIAGLLKLYRIREVMVRRWSSNRNRN